MKKISNTAWGTIANSWLSQIEEGDKIVFKGNYAILYNAEVDDELDFIINCIEHN